MPTWLLLEDEADLCDVLLVVFELLDIRGLDFRTGEDALKWVEEVEAGSYKEELPELALLDIRMPGKVDGTMVSARLRKSAKLANIAIVIMTAYRLNLEEEQAILESTGADYLLYKPLPPIDQMEQVFKSLVKQKSENNRIGDEK